MNESHELTCEYDIFVHATSFLLQAVNGEIYQTTIQPSASFMVEACILYTSSVEYTSEI